MFLIILAICGIFWANLYGWIVALLGMPLLLTTDEEKLPSPIAMALFFLADKYLFLTWPAIVVLTAKIQLADSDGVWFYFAWLVALYLTFAPASYMTAREEDRAVASRAIIWALGAAVVFTFWPAGIFHLYGWALNLIFS